MKESVSNALLFNLVIMFVVILLAFFVGSLSYSKAAKVKNKIIEEIEKNGETAGREYSSMDIADKAFENAEDEIKQWLKVGNDGKSIGYRTTDRGYANCPNYKGVKAETTTNTYEYCVYKINTCLGSNGKENTNKSKCGIYYHVTTYMYFDVPIVEDLVKIPINGETRTFVKRNN